MEDRTQDLIGLLSDTELEHFESLAPSYKKIFVHHAFKSKVEKTQLKNIDEVKEAMELKCKNLHEYKKKISDSPLVPEDADDATKIKIYFDKVADANNRKMVEDLYAQLVAIDPDLHILYAWNNPMIKYKESFNCGLTVAKAHFTLAFDTEALDFFKERIIEKGYGLNLKTFKIKYTQEVDFELLKEMVLFSIALRKDAKGFWK